MECKRANQCDVHYVHKLIFLLHTNQGQQTYTLLTLTEVWTKSHLQALHSIIFKLKKIICGSRMRVREKVFTPCQSQSKLRSNFDTYAWALHVIALDKGMLSKFTYFKVNRIVLWYSLGSSHARAATSHLHWIGVKTTCHICTCLYTIELNKAQWCRVQWISCFHSS